MALAVRPCPHQFIMAPDYCLGQEEDLLADNMHVPQGGGRDVLPFCGVPEDRLPCLHLPNGPQCPKLTQGHSASPLQSPFYHLTKLLQFKRQSGGGLEKAGQWSFQRVGWRRGVSFLSFCYWKHRHAWGLCAHKHTHKLYTV